MAASDNPKLSPEAELHFTRGRLHLKRGEAAMPYAMALPEEKAPPGTDVLMALLGLASVATSRALGQTQWIEEYRSEMRQARDHLARAIELAPAYAPAHYFHARALRYLGENDPARDAARTAAALDPNNGDYAALLRALDGGAGVKSSPTRPAAGARRQNATMNSLPDWDDIVLPAKTRRELRQMQLVIENPNLVRQLGVEPPTGILLYGPPGTGKTTIARILAAQAKCRFFSTSVAAINQMWVGESEKSVQRLFNDARANAPAIIFLDEVDALVPHRAGGMHQYSDKVVNQFLHEMDGLTANQGVFVVGATNRPDMLDPALIRGGRLSRLIEIPLPDAVARRQILEIHTRTAQLATDVDLDVLAAQTENLSGADLRALVNEAGLQALIRLSDTGGPQTVTREDFGFAIENLQRPPA